MKRIYTGIDISKKTLDVAICKSLEPEDIVTFKVENTVKGINKLVDRCLRLNPDMWFCFEHTGNYGLLLTTLLEARELSYSAVPALEIKQSSGMVRGKSDPVDARRIAIYAATNGHKLKRTALNSRTILKIKSLLTFRSQLSRTLRDYKNSLKSYQVTQQSIDVMDIIGMIQEKLIEFKEQIKLVDEKIHSLILSDSSLANTYRKITSVKGVGPIIAYNMIVLTNNFVSFDNNRKFNCYAGLAPFENRSGTSINKGSKTSQLRNKKIKALLFNGANIAVRVDYELKAYYRRKREQGKHHQLIMNNVAAKLVSRMFAVVKRDELYINLQR